MGYAIETKGLSKTYGRKSVVSQLDLKVPDGSVYGFIGPNGAGKSTTMKMLLGLVHPTGGSVTLLGRQMNEKNRLDLLRQTGSLIESPSCYGHLTARENLHIVADLKGTSTQEIDRVLRIVHLDKEEKKVRAFSLGMKQRLGIAQALMGEPKLLILDEPTNGLDPAGIQEMRELIGSLPAICGATVLISSHLLGELEQFINQVGVIGQGKLLFQGEMDQLRRSSQDGVMLRVLSEQKAKETLACLGIRAESLEGGLHLPNLEDEALSEVISALCLNGAGVVQVQRRTRSLEEIFFGLTAGKEGLA